MENVKLTLKHPCLEHLPNNGPDQHSWYNIICFLSVLHVHSASPLHTKKNQEEIKRVIEWYIVSQSHYGVIGFTM